MTPPSEKPEDEYRMVSEEMYEEAVRERDEARAELERFRAGDWTDEERRVFLFEATKASYAQGTIAGCEELSIAAADMSVENEVLRARLTTYEDALREIARLLDEEATGSAVPEPVLTAWLDYYKDRPVPTADPVSIHNADEYLAQERAWELAVAALAETSVGVESAGELAGGGAATSAPAVAPLSAPTPSRCPTCGSDYPQPHLHETLRRGHTKTTEGDA